jgi:hypothetical protein
LLLRGLAEIGDTYYGFIQHNFQFNAVFILVVSHRFEDADPEIGGKFFVSSLADYTEFSAVAVGAGA